MIDLQTAIQGLQEKLQVLLKSHAHLEKENQQLQYKLTQSTTLVASLETALADKQSQLTAALMHKSSMSPAEKAKWVKQIDQYLKEVENCIQNLQP